MSEKVARCLLTIAMLCAKHQAFRPGGVRHWIFQSKTRKTRKGVIPGNGFKKVMLRVGRRIYIDETLFFEWLEEGKFKHDYLAGRERQSTSQEE